MEFALLSDVHASSKNSIGRKDDLVETFFDKFAHVISYCSENNLTLLQAGDLLDRPRDWTVLYRLMGLLDDYRSVQIFCVFGQHDMYMRADTSKTPTSLGILERAGMVHLLGTEPVQPNEYERVYLYGASYNEETPRVTKQTAHGCNLLVAHAPICERPLWHGHQNFKTPQVYAKKNSDFEMILVGDIHREFTYATASTIIVNTGPMLRREANEYNLEHEPCFYTYDTEDKLLVRHVIPHEPAEDVLTRTHIERAEHNEETLVEFVELLEKIHSMDLGVTSNRTVKENVLLYMRENKIGKDVIKVLEEVMSHEDS